MKKFNLIIILLTLFCANPFEVEARNYVNNNDRKSPPQGNYRNNCTSSRAETDLDINNVRARLLAGGDMWWDGVGEARYIVPNVDPASGAPEVSALFAGAIWLGAYDEGGNLILAAQTFGEDGDDYWTGPLDPVLGTAQQSDCSRWDKHFTAYGANIDALRADFLDPLSSGVQNQPSQDLLGWPGRGNPHFLGIHGFDIRIYNQDLAPFIDVNNDGIYNPWDGDHPIIEVTGCEKDNYTNPVYADQMSWWVYNDNGNLHTQSNGQPMKMEIQVTAFGYSTTDAINNMTFYRYKLLNRNKLSLNSTYFSLWTDPDLGCFSDDYIGVDTVSGMGYVYNADANDDNPCGANGVAGYGTDIPALGVDYFRGPLDSAGNEIGLSSFQYHVGGDPGGMGDPDNAIQYYRYMSGFWKDGTPVTVGGNGYDPNNVNALATNYVFPSFPNHSAANDWSMCTESLSGLDQRFLHTSGPFVLKPGATNEMISGVVWVPSIPDYPCPSLGPLVAADRLAQNLFDDCFKITNGPDAPFMDIIEMDKELVLNLSYTGDQNNDKLDYIESPSKLSPYAPLDTSYHFQGYKIYQVNGPNVSVTELDDQTKARMIFQTDVEDDITTIANWEQFTNEAAQIDTRIPVIKVEGENIGLKHTFQVIEDQFAPGEKDLINHKPYYFCVVSYAHNEYKQYDPVLDEGQDSPYLQGRKNFRIYTAIPRINSSEYSGVILKSEYGDQPGITRIDGQGAGAGEFLEISNLSEVEEQILAGNNVGRITYLPGQAPIKIKVVDPLRVPSGTFKMHICDQNFEWKKDSITGAYMALPSQVSGMSDSINWVLTDVNDPSSIWSSYQTIDWEYEQYIPDLGISVSIEQKKKPSMDGKNGYVGAQITYSDSLTNGNWYEGLEDGEGIYNMLKTASGESDHVFDQEQNYSDNVGGWYPFMLCDALRRSDDYYLSLGNIGSSGARFRNETPALNGKVRDTLLAALNNVNVVMTPNRDEWSRCIVVETANIYHSKYHLGVGYPNWKIPSQREQMEWKGSPSATLPQYPSRNKDMSIDNSSVGMSWFPGYAYDVETGQRLNIFFGENSLYNGSLIEDRNNGGSSTGDDMIFNPTSTRAVGDFASSEKVQFLQSVMGGQHIIYVTNMEYDSCQSVLAEFDKVPNMPLLDKDNEIYRTMKITWASMAIPTTMAGAYGEEPPSKATIKLRVNRPYEIERGTFENLGYPLYEFALNGFAPVKEDKETAVSALDLMNVVPNPYYAYSDYEITESENVIKITNIPAKCNIRIYSLDGRFIREYNIAQEYTNTDRNGIARLGMYNSSSIEDQILTSAEWDLKNYAAVPVASGVYLIHVKVDGVGSKVLKSFIINRAFDAQRL